MKVARAKWQYFYRLVLCVAALAVLPELTGCSTFKEAYRVDPVVTDSRSRFNQTADFTFSWAKETFRAVAGNPSIDPIVLSEYKFPGAQTDQLAYNEALSSRESRDRLAAKIVSLSNDMCISHMSGYVSQQALNELVLGSATLGLTAAGAVVTSGASTLAAAATGVGGLSSLVQNSVYYKQLSPSLLKLSMAERKRMLIVIAAKLQTNSLDKLEGQAPPKVEKCPNILQIDVAKEIEKLEAKEEEVATKEADVRKAVKSAGASGDTKKVETAVLEKKEVEDSVAAQRAVVESAAENTIYCRYWKEYPIDSVIADLKRYHDACSFYQALGLASAEIQKKAEDIAKDYDKLYQRAAADATKANQPVTADGMQSPAGGDQAAKPKGEEVKAKQ